MNIYKKIEKLVSVLFYIILVIAICVCLLSGLGLLISGCETSLNYPLPSEGSFYDPDPENLKMRLHESWKMPVGILLIATGCFLIYLVRFFERRNKVDKKECICSKNLSIPPDTKCPIHGEG